MTPKTKKVLFYATAVVALVCYCLATLRSDSLAVKLEVGVLLLLVPGFVVLTWSFVLRLRRTVRIEFRIFRGIAFLAGLGFLALELASKGELRLILSLGFMLLAGLPSHRDKKRDEERATQDNAP